MSVRPSLYNIHSVAHSSWVKQQVTACTWACTEWLRIPTPTFWTHMDVCMHAWSHTTSAFFVSRPDGKQSNTQIQTRRCYSKCVCGSERTHFFPYLFLLPLLLLPLLLLPYLGEALLLALKLSFQVTFVRHGVQRGLEREYGTGVSYVWHRHNML